MGGGGESLAILQSIVPQNETKIKAHFCWKPHVFDDVQLFIWDLDFSRSL